MPLLYNFYLICPLDSKLLSTWEVSVYDHVSFAPDGKTFYAWNVSQGAGIRRWQIPSGTRLSSWDNLDPYPVVFSPDGNLYAASSSKAILIQRVSDQSQTGTFTIVDAQFVSLLRFSPDGSLLAALMNDGKLRIWRIADGVLLGTFESESTVNLFLTISPDNKILALPTLDGVAFYSLADGSLLRRLENHPNGINQAVISPKGDMAAALMEGDGLMVWNLHEGKLAYSISRVGAIYLAWSPDGQWLVLGGWNDNLNILRAKDGATIRNIPTHMAQIQSVDFSPDGKILAASSMDSVKVWQFQGGAQVQSFAVGGGWVPSVKFSPDGKYMAATSASGKLEVWRVSDLQSVAEILVPELSGDRDVFDFTPKDDFLAIAEISKIVLWHLTENKPFLSLPVGDAKVIALRISSDGSLLVCGLTNGTIQFWQISDGKLLRTLSNVGDGIASLDFSADGQILLSASRDGMIRIWKIAK